MRVLTTTGVLGAIAAMLATVLPAAADVAATVGGHPISHAELTAAAEHATEEADLQLLRCQVEAERSHHEALQAVLDSLVEQQLLTLEAGRTGATLAELQARMLQAAQPVTDEDVEAFYSEHQESLGVTLADIADQIRDYLAEKAEQAAQDEFYAALEQRFSVTYRFGPYRIDVAADGFPSYGPTDAPVTLVEFSDFECPYCALLLPTLEQVKEHYDRKVRIVYRQHPLRSHPFAWKAAEASLCADEQGEFWPMHDTMFAEQEALAVPDLKEMARRLGLDGKAFDQCLDSHRYHEAVQADIRAGAVAGVSGTPSLFVNGRFVEGAVPFSELAAVIDQELAAAP